MNVNQIQKVMEKYGRAWEKQDSTLLLECFNKNGIYQESPINKPYRGHFEIRKFWETVVCRDTKNIRFTLKNCYVSDDGQMGFAKWECRNTYLGKKQHMTGIILLKMRGSKISQLNEYWNTKTG